MSTENIALFSSLQPKQVLGLTPRPRFVITGTGRSGTAYIAAVLSEAGVPCGHEAWFRIAPGLWDRQTIPRPTLRSKLRAPLGRLHEEQRRRRQRLVGDASWLAVPRLRQYRGLVYLQLRHPVAVIRSLSAIRFFSPPLDRWAVFASRHFELSGDEIRDAMRWWVEWNERALHHARLSWRLEDLDEDLLVRLLRDIRVPDAEERAAAALANVHPTNTARQRGKALPSLTWSDLPAGFDRERLAGLASRLGYDPEEQFS